MKVCSIDDCDRKFYARGWCTKHYRRWLTTGDPTKVLKPHEERVYVIEPLGDRFWKRVEKGQADDCWMWRGHINHSGYGDFHYTASRGIKARAMAHRLAYELLVGPIPDGLHLDHLCVNPPCVNPSHLEPVTPTVNSQRVGLRRTHCKHGHEFTPENTYHRPDTGKRQCRACNAARRGYKHDCGVPDCGLIRCRGCDERLMCVGPEPSADSCVDHPTCVGCAPAEMCLCCSCRELRAQMAEDRRAELDLMAWREEIA